MRRRLHNLIAYGALAALVSTIAAGFSEHVLGSHPPYPYLSVPVMAGLIGGIAMTIGCTGMLIVRRSRDRALEVGEMGDRGTALIAALDALAVSGLLTLFTRNTSAFGIVLVVHLATIVVCFAVLPYSKFMHVLYRFLAIVRDNREIELEPRPPAQLLEPR
jgi:citrate/tricarballylate utilization protein